MNDLSKLISEPTHIPDRSGDKANTLDLFLTSNPNVYSNHILDSPLGNSDHCLITLQHNFVSHQDRSSSSQKVFYYSKADWHSLCNSIAAYRSNLNSVYQYLQSFNPHARFLTETKIKPLGPNDISILCPRLKCPGYELFSSFFQNGGVCAYVHSNVQNSRRPQFDLDNPGFELIWIKS